MTEGSGTPQFGIVVLRLRTALHFACAVFRVFAPPSPSAARCSGAADALWAWPQFGMVVPHLRTVPPLAARCSVAAHCALLRVLTTSALRAFGCSQARLRRSLVPTIRNSRLATLPLASLLCSLDFRFACFAHCARRSSVPIGLTPRCFAHWARASCAPLALSLGVFLTV